MEFFFDTGFQQYFTGTAFSAITVHFCKYCFKMGDFHTVFFRHFWQCIDTIALLLHLRNQLDVGVKELAHRTADRYGLDPRLVEAVVRAESRGDPEAVSKAAAYGLMQLKTATASEMAGRKVTREELFDPELNLELGCRYLKRLFDAYGGDLRLTLMAYNAGPGRVREWRARTDDVEKILSEHAFGETRHYVKRVLGYYEDAQ